MTYEAFIFPAKNKLAHPESQRWADLGCGNGIFTELLAGIIPAHSKIFAVDRMSQRLNTVMGNAVSVAFQKTDFEKDELNLNSLDGILMANALHFIHDKESLIRKLGSYFAEKKQFLIVEYETESANQWVPFPINFKQLKELFYTLGYQSVEQLNTRRSNYGGEMYMAFVH